MEENIKALGGSALDRASAGGVLATEMIMWRETKVKV